MVALILAVLLLAALLFQWNWLKGPIQTRVSAATGREFVIEGDLDVDLGRITTVRADRLRLANGPGWDEPQMATLGQLEADIALWPLLRGRVDIVRLHLRKPRLLLERNAQGRANWVFHHDAPARDTAPATLPIRALTVTEGELRVKEPSLQTDLRLDIHSAPAPQTGIAAPLVARGEGRYRQQPFRLQAQVDSPLDLQQTQHPYRIALQAQAGATRAALGGSLDAPLQLRDFDLDFELAGDDLAALYPLLGIALPPTPPYRLKGRIGRDASAWHYRGFRGTVGDSDLAGDLRVAVDGPRPRLVAQLQSRQLDLDDLGGFVGAPPATGDGEVASAAQRQAAAARAANPRVLPDSPYNLEKMRAMDADVRLRVAALHAPRLPLESMTVRLRLDDGLLRLDPLQVGIAGGSLAGSLQLDARSDPIKVQTALRLRNLDLPKLMPGSEMMQQAVGRISGSIALHTQGNSVAAMLAHADGDIGAAMGEGRISALLVELAGLDLAEALRFLIGRDRDIALHCAYADFAVEDGVMRARALALDTSDTALHGEGRIDLRQETLALRLLPEPKDRSPLTLRSPLKIGGTFKSPSIRPEAGPLTLRAAIAAGLFAIAPPAALLALIETGPGRDLRCRSD